MDEDFRTSFARNIKFYLAREGKTQADMAKRMHVSSTTVSDWCNGRKIPRADKLQAICDWLCISMTQLADNDDPFTNPPKVPTKEALELATQIIRDSHRRRVVDMLMKLDSNNLETIEILIERLSK